MCVRISYIFPLVCMCVSTGYMYCTYVCMHGSVSLCSCMCIACICAGQDDRWTECWHNIKIQICSNQAYHQKTWLPHDPAGVACWQRSDYLRGTRKPLFAKVKNAVWPFSCELGRSVLIVWAYECITHIVSSFSTCYISWFVYTHSIIKCIHT
jgi:hypothetical protein